MSNAESNRVVQPRIEPGTPRLNNVTDQVHEDVLFDAEVLLVELEHEADRVHRQARRIRDLNTKPGSARWARVTLGNELQTQLHFEF